MTQREFKFRCWDGRKMWILNKGNNLTLSFFSEGIAWGLYDSATEQRYVCDVEGAIHSNTGILMQYFGLKDKHGKDIYEGDVVRFLDENYQVIYFEQYASFMLLHSNGNDLQNITTQEEVIGNIYENPELL